MKRARWLVIAAVLDAWSLIMPGAANADMSSTIYPYLELAGVYTDNAQQQSSEHARGDFIATELLGGSLQTAAPNKYFGVDYTTLGAQYISTPSLDRTFQDHFVGASYDQGLSTSITLSLRDTLLVGNPVTSMIITGGTVPFSPQLLQSLLFRSSTLDNLFNVETNYTSPTSWDLGANVYQLFFNGSGTEGSFGQGATLIADYPLNYQLRVGSEYDFEDFRYTQRFPPTETHWPQVRLIWSPDSNFSVLLRGGPIFFDNFAGGSNGFHRSGGWSIDPGGMLVAKYSGRKVDIALEGGQQPGIGAGLGEAGLYRNSSFILDYAVSRSLSVFARQGFLDISAPHTNAQVITYTVGVSYQVSKNFLLTAQYYGIRNLLSGTSAQIVGIKPGTQPVTNLFLIGVICELDPIRWRW
jgi:hypothetical protein